MKFGFSFLIVFTLLALSYPVVADSTAQDPRGQWLRADGVARVNVAPCGPELCMTNVWIKPGVRGEKVGEYIRFDVKAAGPGHWKGTGYDPQRKLEFSSDLEIAGDTMTTGGCLVGGLICKSTSWTRVP
jgi:uncharacterized protein (DUF2147 family)